MTWLTFIEHLCQRLILRIDMFAIVPIPSSFPFLLLSTDLAKRRVARRMSLVGQELPTLPENTCAPRFLVAFVLLDLQFSVVFLYIVVGPFVFGYCMCCLSVFELLILTTLLGSSNRHL